MAVGNDVPIDHDLCISDICFNKVQTTEKELNLIRKKLRLSQQKVRRLNKKVSSLKKNMKKLKTKCNLDTCKKILEKILNEVPYELIKRIVSGKNKKKYGKYSPALRSFALTLQFYSSKAYAFVRKTFHLSLPHPSQVRRWYSQVPADPGFTEPAFKTLQVSFFHQLKDDIYKINYI